MTTETPRFVIEGRDDSVGSGWSTDAIGDYTEFPSREDAEAALAELLDDANGAWRECDCRVTEVRG